MNDTSSMIGKLLPQNAERDAIHVAVLPAEAGVVLYPGQWVELDEKGCAVANKSSATALGIVDPFLVRQIFPGERIFIFLRPNTVTGMRHHWTHPSVKDVETGPALERLRAFAERWKIDLDNLMTAQNPGSVLHAGDELYADEGFNETALDEFWRDLATVTGRTFDDRHKSSIIWKCSC